MSLPEKEQPKAVYVEANSNPQLEARSFDTEEEQPEAVSVESNSTIQLEARSFDTEEEGEKS